jgi:hypothetical protein
MADLLKNEEDTGTSDEVYSVSHPYEHRTQEDIAQATGIKGERLQLN